MIIDGTTIDVSGEILVGLENISGLAYSTADAILNKNGNTPGTNPPVLYAISRLVSEGKVKSVLELGSGMSTLYLSQLNKKFGLKYISVEDELRWFTLNKNVLLSSESKSTDNLIHRDTLSVFNSEYRKNIDPDLIFIDSGEHRKQAFILCLTYWPSSIIMVDDCEQPYRENSYQTLLADMHKTQARVFLSHTRGVLTFDPNNKIDFIQWRDQEDYINKYLRGE